MAQNLQVSIQVGARLLFIILTGSFFTPAAFGDSFVDQFIPSYKTADGNELVRFQTDYCSSFDEQSIDSSEKVATCCIDHDFYYWLGGTEGDRLDADLRLKKCVSENFSAVVAQSMYLAVRGWGRPGTGKSYQWGYGWLRNRGYEPLPLASQISPINEESADFCQFLHSQYELKESAKSHPEISDSGFDRLKRLLGCSR